MANPQYFRLRAHFLAGRYHGAEWPPAPARVFQALVAGVMTGQWRDSVAPGVRDALLWLQCQPAPVIVAQEMSDLEAYRISVPNNDMDRAAKEWAKGRSFDASKLRTMKEVTGREASQDGPHVQYYWPISEKELVNAQSHERALKQASHCLHTLGWGIDMAFADVDLCAEVDRDAGAVWKAGDSGQTLPVPVDGFLEDLESAYRRFQKRIGPSGVNADTRPTIYGEERYSREGKVGLGFLGLTLLPSAEGSREALLKRPAQKAAVVAGWLRHAAIEAVRASEKYDKWGEYVSGHGDAKEGERLSFVPLPSIGASKADGWVRRALIVAPPGGDPEVLAYLRQALVGGAIRDERIGVVGSWGPMDDRDSVLRAYLGPNQGSKHWRSVTPVVLHGHNALRGQVSMNKTTKLVLEAFRKAGYPEGSIEDFYLQSAPLTPQLPAAGQFFLPKQLAKLPRYHVGVQFRESVNGPVLAGIGRHAGLGVFRASSVFSH